MARREDKIQRLSDAGQDYLREIYRLETEDRRATTSSVATAVGVSAPSASLMLKRLAELELVVHTPYRGAELTDTGRSIALEVVRHHRLLEMWLTETLGMPLEQVHAEADRLEHALSEDIEERIDAALGHPTHDPHGHPIPDPQLNVAAPQTRTVLDLEPGEEAVVSHVPDRDGPLLRYLADLGLTPGKPVTLTAVAPFGGPVTLRSGSGEHAIARDVADAIGVA